MLLCAVLLPVLLIDILWLCEPLKVNKVARVLFLSAFRLVGVLALENTPVAVLSFIVLVLLKVPVNEALVALPV